MSNYAKVIDVDLRCQITDPAELQAEAEAVAP